MRIAILQPEHFPYLGFFQKMSMSDVFVILDDVKYCKNEYYHRNKFKNQLNMREQVKWKSKTEQPKKPEIIPEEPKKEKVIRRPKRIDKLFK